MKFITDYKELNGSEKNSVLNHISDTPISEKDKLLRYLKSGNEKAIRCSSIFDYVKNNTTFETIHLFTDGEYDWDSEEMYHFENYNLELNPDFIKKILES